MLLKRRYKDNWPGSWLAVLAVLVQALMPVLHHPAGMAMAGMSGFGNAVNMCLAPGGAAPGSNLPGDHAPGNHDNGPAHPMPDCPLCQAVHAIGGFAPPSAAVTAPIRANVPIGFAAAKTASIPKPAFRGNAQPRAPPVQT
jgi:hypothetical protein